MATTKSDVAERPFGRWVQILLYWICRICLGVTFIFSGFVKAIDPWGTIYKLGDYLNALGLENLISLAVPLAFALFIIEFCTGVFVLLGCYRRLSVWLAALIMAVMLPLTLWIALANPVEDCGCFGDAIILSNWQTLWKNVCLLLMTLYLLFRRVKAPTLIQPAIQWIALIATCAFIIIIGLIGYWYQPLIDFRPYKIESSIIDENAESNEPVLLSKWTNGKETITVPADSIPGDEWEFVDRVSADSSLLNSRHNLKQLTVYDENGEDITSELFNEADKQMILFFSSLDDLRVASYYQINSLSKYCDNNNISMFAIVSADDEQIEKFKDLSLADYPIYTSEDTSIKEVVRGNPGVVYLEEGIIKWKSSLNSIETTDFLSEDTSSNPLSFGREDSKILQVITLFYLIILAALILLSQIPAFVNFAIKKNKSKLVKPLMLCILCTSIFASCSSNEEPDYNLEDKSLTILIYMVATNNLDSDSYNDIEEIVEGIKVAHNNNCSVLLYEAHNNESPVLSKFVLVEGDKVKKVAIKTYNDNELSVSPNRFKEVLCDMQKFSPADNFGLFLWSHASSWVYSSETSQQKRKSFGIDYRKSINIDKLTECIHDNLFSFIWMDCCNMGSIEVAYQLRNKCNIFVGYPTEVMAEGAPYNLILPCLMAEQSYVVGAAKEMYNYYLSSASIKCCTICVLETRFLETLSSVCRDIVHSRLMQESIFTDNNLQSYGSYRISGSGENITYWDMSQYFHLYANYSGNGHLLEQYDKAIADVILYKATTSKFLNINIDENLFSGLSTHIPSTDTNNSENEKFYKSLDWWQDVYSN